LLEGAHIDERVAADAAKRALEGATPLAQNAYKIPLFEALVRRAILAAVN
jgi:xanthine dehydrogenase YagS FAD-binding subunit